jgi:hypothetical protein
MTEHQDEMPTPPPGSPGGDQLFEDYWGVDARERFTFPDGKQWIEFKILNEGERAEYEKKSSKDLVLQQRTGEARVSSDPAGDRHKLLKTSVTDWYLMQRDPKAESGWSPAPFSARSFEMWLEKANPKIVDKLEFEIRMANPWLQSDMTKEQIKEQIEDLERMLKEKEREELGEGPS